MKSKNNISVRIVMIFVILVIINFLSDRFFFRIDATKDNQYTLSEATKNILKELDEPITVTAYFTEDVPALLLNSKRNFRELLMEYESASDGNVVFQFIDPSEDKALQEKALRDGVQSIMVNVIEKDQEVKKEIYLGAVIRKGTKSERIYVQPGMALEYNLSSLIKKLSVEDHEKMKIGYITGHGEPPLSNLKSVRQGMDILYKIEPVLLTDTANLSQYEALMFVGPKDTMPVNEINLLNNYIVQGGNMFIALDRVTGNFSNAQGSAMPETGIKNWLRELGLNVEDSFIVDASCDRVGVRQPNNPFPVSVSFPYFPTIRTFNDHPIMNGLESITMTYASPVSFIGDTSLNYEILARSSEKSGKLSAPLYFNINKRWNQNDFPLENIPVAVALSGNIAGNNNSKIVLITDSEFLVNSNSRRMAPSHAGFVVNSVDWLSDDTGLIELRNKGLKSNPIEQLESGTKTFLKWLNFMLPLLIVIIYGIIRSQINRNKRVKRMEDAYV